ncbi:hypothetical protein [Pseudomonas sp. BTN1]|uniref:hypothetical protein n=1 Tax=Pseudomonas sp. BTN1 TaxID=1750647 RepID=UPI0015A73C99|nr:hypothetical protein [Pseudomonas sp. BTN1]
MQLLLEKKCQKAQSPGIRGFDCFCCQEICSESDMQVFWSVLNAGSSCIEAVHSLQALHKTNVGAGLPAMTACQPYTG